MLDQTVSSRGGVPIAPGLFLMLALAIGASAAEMGRVELGLLAVLPFSWAVTYGVFGREPHFRAKLTETGIEVEDPPGVVRYDEILNLSVGGRIVAPEFFKKRCAKIAVNHARGHLHIPSRLDVPSSDLVRFLAERIAPLSGGEVNPALSDYLRNQQIAHGADRVWTFRARTQHASARTFRGVRAFGAGMAVAGAVWLGFAAAGVVEAGWGVAGGFVGVFGLMFFGAAFFGNSPVGNRIKRWKEASVVVSPEGLGMVQGEIQGVIKWAEVQEIKFKPKASGLVLTSHDLVQGIVLRVPGANIVIADIYDRPLFVIHRVIREASNKADTAVTI